MGSSVGHAHEGFRPRHRSNARYVARKNRINVTRSVAAFLRDRECGRAGIACQRANGERVGAGEGMP